MQKELLSKLGLNSNSRVLIPNHDDLGMSFGSNVAFLKLCNVGFIKSGSVMVPCPWFPHLVNIAGNNPKLNIGVHLTLTSEWSNYRWKPLTTNSISSGLIDGDGYFWKNRQLLRLNVNKQAAEVELRAQIEKALKAGIDVTHLDCHMGIGIIPELIDVYIKLGKDYKLPILLPKNIKETLKLYKLSGVNDTMYTNIINELIDNNYPLVDHFKITPCFDSKVAQLGYENLISGIPKGITFLSLHPNKPGDIENIDTVMYHARIDECKIFSENYNSAWTKAKGIDIISFRQIRDVLRKS